MTPDRERLQQLRRRALLKTALLADYSEYMVLTWERMVLEQGRKRTARQEAIEAYAEYAGITPAQAITELLGLPAEVNEGITHD